MEMQVDRFEAIRTLIAAVDAGSLSAASRTLNTPLATVSRRISDLEAHLGAQLLVRTSRKLIPTEAGEAYVASVRKLMDDLSDAERMASGEYRAPRGELLITAPIMFGKLHVAPLVHAFLAAYPDVSVRLVLADYVIDLVEAHIDVAIRIGTLRDSDLVARRVGQVGWTLVASPDYLATSPPPLRPADLIEHSCIAFEGLQRHRDWGFGRGATTETVQIRPQLSINTADAVIAAALGRMGIARVMTYQAASVVDDGLLVPLLREFAPEPLTVSLVHRPQRSQPLKQRAFLDFITPRLQATLEQIERIMA
jgi:DNA-binding transcriptional LysR family regulator